MMNSIYLDRLTKEIKPFEKILNQQAKEKRNEIVEEDDDMDFIAEILLEIMNHLSSAKDLCAEAAALLDGEVIEAACCCPGCSMKGGCCYDE